MYTHFSQTWGFLWNPTVSCAQKTKSQFYSFCGIFGNALWRTSKDKGHVKKRFRDTSRTLQHQTATHNCNTRQHTATHLERSRAFEEAFSTHVVKGWAALRRVHPLPTYSVRQFVRFSDRVGGTCIIESECAQRSCIIEMCIIELEWKYNWVGLCIIELYKWNVYNWVVSGGMSITDLYGWNVYSWVGMCIIELDCAELSCIKEMYIKWNVYNWVAEGGMCMIELYCMIERHWHFDGTELSCCWPTLQQVRDV